MDNVKQNTWIVDILSVNNVLSIKIPMAGFISTGCKITDKKGQKI